MFVFNTSIGRIDLGNGFLMVTVQIGETRDGVILFWKFVHCQLSTLPIALRFNRNTFGLDITKIQCYV